MFWSSGFWAEGFWSEGFWEGQEAIPAKVGGDDVPRYEVWEKKRKFKRDDWLEATIEETYRKLTGYEAAPEVVKEVIAEARAVEEQDVATITQLIQQQIDEEEDEILLLLAA